VKHPVLAANWKMNNGPTAAKTFMDTFLAGYPLRGDRTIIIFPPAVSLTTVAIAASSRPDVLAGVQNIHWAEKGAFTGEISAPMAKDAGARVVLVGHSERRHVFGETDAQCAKKCLAASRAKLPFRAKGGGRDQGTRDAATPRRALANAESHLSRFSAGVRAGVGDRHGIDCIRRRCVRNSHVASI